MNQAELRPLADTFLIPEWFQGSRFIAVINTWNRLNVTTSQVAGEWTAQWVS